VIRFATKRTFLAVWATVLMTAAQAASATTVLLDRETTIEDLYTPGGTFDVTVTIDVETAGTVTTLGLEEHLPAGWTFEGSAGGVTPLVAPETGSEGNAGLLEFVWIPLPALPFSYTYRVGVPESATGTRQLRGEVIALVLAQGATISEEFHSPLVVTVLPGAGVSGIHSADTNGDNLISLSELLRVIQFFNIGGYHCATDLNPTEDGFRPGFSGPKTCDPHSGDYNPQNWIISLSELLRLIQFFNSGGYQFCPEANTEDDFCVGLPS